MTRHAADHAPIASSGRTDAPLERLEGFVREHSTALRGGARPDLLDHASRLRDEATVDAGLLPPGVAWRLGFAHHVRGEYRLAVGYFDAADRAAEEADAADLSLVEAGHASSLWAQGDTVAARRHADDALELARAAGDELAIATAWVAQALVFAADGERTANLRAYETALEHAERAGDALTIVRIRSNMGSMHSEEGRHAEALLELDEAILLAASAGVGVVGALSYINRAEALLALGRLDEAVAEAAVAVETYRAARSPMHVFALLLEADIHRVRGNATRAQVRYREASDRAEATGDAQVLTVAFAGLARTLISDDPSGAVEAARRALELPNALGNVAAQLAAGWVALATGEPETAREWSRRAVAEAGRRHDDGGLADALELGGLARLADGGTSGEVNAALAEAAGIWQEIGDAIRIAVNRALVARVAGDAAEEGVALRVLRSLGVRVDVFRIAGPLQAIGRLDVPAVEVRLFGSFAVLHGGEPLAAEGWPSRKSREVVMILAARRHRPIGREALGELVWPGGRDTSARLSVALSNARLALDPERRYPTGHFISTTHSRVRLDPGTVRVDVAEFEHVARAGLAAAERGAADAVATLEAAAALYPAPVLDGEPAADWVTEAAEELRDLVVEVKRTLVRLLEADTDAERSIGWSTSLLNDDPFDESAHRALIRALVRVRRFGEARRAYERYVARMTQLDVTPEPLDRLAGTRLGT
jgi:DNA-binding SARP family transcriptional activator/Tfp pilus assembly protein PilF